MIINNTSFYISIYESFNQVTKELFTRDRNSNYEFRGGEKNIASKKEPGIDCFKSPLEEIVENFLSVSWHSCSRYNHMEVVLGQISKRNRDYETWVYKGDFHCQKALD